MENDLLHEALSYQVMGAVFRVHNVLKCGLLESAYEAALIIELRQRGIQVECQKRFELFYEGERAGVYVADLVVEGKIILELKSVKRLHGYMEAQLLNYLRLSGIEVGYLVNFYYERIQYRRFVLSRS
jgi:GxxExxY protein